MTHSIKLTRDITNYLQSAQYDKDNLEFLIAKLSLSNLSLDDMNYWKSEYLEAANKLRIAKDFINSNFIFNTDFFKDKKNLTWKINFDTDDLEVSWDEDKSN